MFYTTDAVLLSEYEFNSMQETLYLLRSPADAARLAQGIAQAESGDVVEFRPEGDR